MRGKAEKIQRASPLSFCSALSTTTVHYTKGQLISKGHFDVFKSTKKPTEF